MAHIQQEDIDCFLECNKQVEVFDADNLADQEEENNSHHKQQQQTKDNKQELQTRVNTQQKQQTEECKLIEAQIKIDQQFISKLEDQLKNSQSGFFAPIKKNKPTLPPLKSKPLQPIKNLQQMSSNSILKQGWMQKKTDGIIFKWKLRYFTLTPEKLFFFENQKKTKVIGCVNMKIMVLQVKLQGQQLLIDFMGECENIILKCESKKALNEWKQLIQQVAKFQSKQKKLLINTLNKPFYQQTTNISEAQFLNEAQTGDILLFHTRHLGAKVQRAVTNSDFDHVAMVVRFRKSELMVFQSNPTLGVSLFQWNQFVRAFVLYEKIAFRKLVSHRKFQIQHNLLKFVKMNLGRKYDISISKLLTFESDFSWQKVNEQINRSYFCSQLVAKAYKSAGLLDEVKSSCRYWPVDFSQKNEIKLYSGACLGHEQLIVLNRHVKKII